MLALPEGYNSFKRNVNAAALDMNYFMELSTRCLLAWVARFKYFVFILAMRDQCDYVVFDEELNIRI